MRRTARRRAVEAARDLVAGVPVVEVPPTIPWSLIEHLRRLEARRRDEAVARGPIVYGAAVIPYVARAAVCALRGHDHDPFKRFCRRCRTTDEWRWAGSTTPIDAVPPLPAERLNRAGVIVWNGVGSGVR